MPTSYFNPTLVRFKLYYIIHFCHFYHHFNPTLVRFKLIFYYNDKKHIVVDFNPTLVRFKQVNGNVEITGLDHFNPTLVRFKQIITNLKKFQSRKFQSYLSPI